MRLKHSKLRQAIALSLVASGAFAGTVFAQDAAPQAQQQSQTQATNLDNVIVTGSRIKSQTMTSSSPVTEISGETFQQIGATKVEDLVNQYPQLDMNFDNFDNNPSTGYATASLRQLGAARTLTLVNGRRMPAGTSESTDLSIIPASLVKRVDVLSGGASAVYGADAVAGVVNFVLDDEFEGVNFNLGWSAYQHNNDNKIVQGYEQDKGFAAPSGSTGFDGISRNFDLTIGGAFGDNGHAVGYLTYRKNDALMQGDIDYSACSVSSYGEGCLGSGTADPGNFNVKDPRINPATGKAYGARYFVYSGNNSYAPGKNVYNFAPENFFQRPDERYTAGFMAKYEVNDHFTPYAEALFVDRKSSVQIAESGTFGLGVTVPCDAAYVGTLCADTGNAGASSINVNLYKRNVEGGPRISDTDTQTYRITAGVKGDIAGSWSYDAYALYGATHSSSIGHNDFLFSRIADAVTCDTVANPNCTPAYDIWHDAITPAAAQALAGTSFTNVDTQLKELAAYATGNLGFGMPWANGEEFGLVVGAERRITTFVTAHDTDSLEGNFAGAGSASPNIDAIDAVNDYYTELALPLVVTSGGAFDRLDASLGFRHSDYDTSGGTNTYKAGLSASFLDNTLLLRGGYNRAIRAPGLNDFYFPATVALDGTVDYCAGATPLGTQEQCARAGVPASAYGTVPENTAQQYNGMTGGNPDLKPEVADTYTLGVAWEPIKNLNLALDWYSIKIKDGIGSIGYETIQQLCMNQGTFCDLIHRNTSAGNYDLWIGASTDPNVGYITDTEQNIGILQRNGLDLNASYNFDLGPGRLSTSFVGTYVLKDYNQPLAADNSTGYECKGLVDVQCWSPKWRHVATARYSFDRYNVGLRWRYIGGTSFKDAYTGAALTADDNMWLAPTGGIGSVSYFDLSASATFSFAVWTVGVNNVGDKAPPFVGYDGGINNGTSNAMNGYDQVGRYIFTSLSFKF